MAHKTSSHANLGNYSDCRITGSSHALHDMRRAGTPGQMLPAWHNCGELLRQHYTAMEVDVGIEVAAANAGIRILCRWLMIEQFAKGR